MSAAKNGDTLSEIRHEYKAKKEQLDKYNTFIDRHQGLVVFMPPLLVLIGALVLVGITSGSTGDNLAAKVIGILSLALLAVAIVMAFITGGRKSAKNKIDKQLEALTKEATVFRNTQKTTKISAEMSWAYGVILSKIRAATIRVKAAG